MNDAPAYRKKLIEVALPLPEINDASSYDKMPGIGPHPKGIHHWWARLPLPTARAVLFASVVTDPSDDPEWKDKSEAEQDCQARRTLRHSCASSWVKSCMSSRAYIKRRARKCSGTATENCRRCSTRLQAAAPFRWRLRGWVSPSTLPT